MHKLLYQDHGHWSLFLPTKWNETGYEFKGLSGAEEEVTHAWQE